MQEKMLSGRFLSTTATKTARTDPSWEGCQEAAEGEGERVMAFGGEYLVSFKY